MQALSQTERGGNSKSTALGCGYWASYLTSLNMFLHIKTKYTNSQVFFFNNLKYLAPFRYLKTVVIIIIH